MLAAVLKSPGIIELMELPDPICPNGGVLLKVLACAVCGTDVKIVQNGHKDLTYPRVLGHEIAGKIIETGGTIDLSKGDLVQVWPGAVCGICRPCCRGTDNHCQKMKILGFNMDGGFAELLAIPGERLSCGLNALPSYMDPGIAALAEPLACCINGQEMARVSPGDNILIYGGGPIGSLHALLAETKEAGKIIVLERLEHRRTILEKHANVLAICPQKSLKDTIAAETEGNGIDVILTATPKVSVDDSLLKLLNPGGRICVFSGPKTTNRLQHLDLGSLHYREITLTGAYGCSSRQNREAVRLLTAGKIRADWIITKRTGLSNIHEAMSHSKDRCALKSVICDR